MSIEYPEVVVGLWKLFDSFIAASEPKLLPQNLTFLTSSDGTYNHWMYYTNFEISHRSLFKNPWWPQLWQQMEDSRAIHWARWWAGPLTGGIRADEKPRGDAPIRTMWVHAFAKNSQIARIEDAVYSHGYVFGILDSHDRFTVAAAAEASAFNALAIPTIVSAHPELLETSLCLSVLYPQNASCFSHLRKAPRVKQSCCTNVELLRAHSGRKVLTEGPMALMH